MAEDKEHPKVEDKVPSHRRKTIRTNHRAIESNAIRPEVKEELVRKQRQIEVK